MLSLTEEQITTLYCFKTWIRENDWEDEICDYCLTDDSLSSWESDKCTCSKNKYHIGDFKLYEKLLPILISEISYYYDPLSRYIYVLNQNKTILRVIDMDDLETKTGTELADGYDHCTLEAIMFDPLMSLIFMCCRIIKDLDTLNAKKIIVIKKTLDLFFEDSDYYKKRILILFSIIHQEEHLLFKILCHHPLFNEEWQIAKQRLGGPND